MVVASGSIAGNIIDLLTESPLKHRFGVRCGRSPRSAAVDPDVAWLGSPSGINPVFPFQNGTLRND
jgi:hypothetical protein